MVKLSKGESGLDPKRKALNTNGTFDKGAFQVNDCNTCEWQAAKGKAKPGCIPDKDREDLRKAEIWTIGKIQAGGLMMWVYAQKAGLKYKG